MTQGLSETDELLTSAEASALLRVSRRTLYRWQQRGYIKPASTPSGQYRYYRKDVEALFARPERVVA